MKKLARWTEQLLIGAGDRPESAATGEERARRGPFREDSRVAPRRSGAAGDARSSVSARKGWSPHASIPVR